MRITVVVKPNSRTAAVTVCADGSLAVRVDAPARGGAANRRLLELLAEHFGVAKSLVRVRNGARGRTKIVDVSVGER